MVPTPERAARRCTIMHIREPGRLLQPFEARLAPDSALGRSNT